MIVPMLFTSNSSKDTCRVIVAGPPTPSKDRFVVCHIQSCSMTLQSLASTDEAPAPLYKFSDRYSGQCQSDDIFQRGSFVERDIQVKAIQVGAPDHTASTHEHTKYNGRLKRWPGIVLLVVVVGVAAVAVALFAIDANKTSMQRRDTVQKMLANRARIESGLEGMDSDEQDNDGVFNNPKEYKPLGCELPDYQSKRGKIWAVSKNGTEVPVAMKGVNWFGMETGMMAPFGLWDNDHNGTTVYAVANFLSANKFNSVRLPLCVENILGNKPLDVSFINRQTNRALDLTSYLSLVQTIVKGLGYRSISVMLSMHTLNLMNTDGSL
ncbi:hypothetical protein As57867_016517, partial [Aphanomyces stellatus]